MSTPMIHLVDDDEAVRLSMERLLKLEGYQVRTYESAEQFLKAVNTSTYGCLLCDVRMPGGMSGVDMLATLKKLGLELPTVFMTGYGDIPNTVRAMKLGATNYLTKPVRIHELLKTIKDCLSNPGDAPVTEQREALRKLDAYGLSRREAEVIQLVVGGEQNKDIARLLGISPRTVEIHRSNGMKKVGVTNMHGLLMAMVEKDAGVKESSDTGSDATLHLQLKALSVLLANCDIEAISTFEALRPKLKRQLHAAIRPMEEALKNLKMKEALDHCVALVHALDLQMQSRRID